MKTYTIEQIKKYIQSQDSLGDVMYNLNNIDKYLVSDEIKEIENDGALNDYLLEMEYNQGNKFSYEGVVYEISDDVTSFIRDYSWDILSQMICRNPIKELSENGLIYKV